MYELQRGTRTLNRDRVATSPIHDHLLLAIEEKPRLLSYTANNTPVMDKYSIVRLLAPTPVTKYVVGHHLVMCVIV